jgi:signal transduction histidine kinase
VAKTKLFPLLEQSGDAGALAWAARMNQGIYSIMRIVSNLRLLGDTGALRNSYKQRTNLGEWLEQLVQRLEPLMQEAQRELVVELPTQEVLCNINGDLLQRALLNVISNSIKYTEPGGKILLRVKRKGSGHIQISVQDDGCGISGEAIKTLEQIFSLGPQISDSRSGTGLGLYMAKKIMADHGGDLFLEWKKDQGTIVYLLLDTVSQQPQELEVRFRPPIMDSYSGYDPLLQELADVLPSSVFDLRGVD